MWTRSWRCSHCAFSTSWCPRNSPDSNNNITGQWLAASASLGVAALPVYTGDADRRLVRVLADTVTVNRTYWLVVPRDIRRLARVRAVVEILRAIAATHRGLLTPGSLPEIHRGP